MTAIIYEEFEGVNLRSGTIVKVEEFPRAKNPAFKVWVDFGSDAGEVWSDNGGENLYHASLSPDEYKKILKQYDFTLINHKIDDPECDDATIWLARLNQKHQE